ncbi:8-demethyl-8-aminoriboflavin-5'-phosphate synthase RosB [Streptomyces sp. NPDC004647]|uniref:8-demethyl-8-aminoriboflavin-5'-phosphate synthase RosB n=1 Tax=Streptomyces sp. NPDC004647 TaxID=3154671 RepID=UPI0033B4A676
MTIKALILNTTLRRSPSRSQTQGLIDKAVAGYQKEGIETEVIRVIDHDIEQEYWDDFDDWNAGEKARRKDEWPWLLGKIKAADILVIATPITLNMCTSAAHVILEKLNLMDELNADTGQFPLYNKVAGLLMCGNEDGAHHVAGTVLNNLGRLGYIVPPNSAAYWLGPAGTGPGYIEAHGDKHFHTNKLIRFMVSNTAQMARILDATPLTTNLADCAAEARAESSEVFAIRVNVDTPAIRYKRFQNLGDVPLTESVLAADEESTPTKTA